jgi:amidase
MRSKIRREFVAAWAALALLVAACSGPAEDYSEISVAELHDRMQRGEVSSEQLVRWYLERIEMVDRSGPELRAIIELNPDALMTARALDEEWQESGPRGPLHGIPVVLKANIDTADKMRTTAGSLALADHTPRQDAFIVSQLRDAGAIILAKANLSEWANYRSARSSSGWSSIGGQTRNPYDPLRTPCGSSSGSAVAVAANLTMVAVGTETDGSVICPSGINGIVGIKPTIGLVSRSGIIPIAHSQDTAGPMGRSVRDAAILLTAMTGSDVSDPSMSNAPTSTIDYAANLAADGLAGKRIGVIRTHYGAGSNPNVEDLLTETLDSLRASGAEVVDNVEVDTEGVDDAESTVLSYEFKADLAMYLANSDTGYSTLADIIAYNDAHADTVMPIFGQERMLAAEARGTLDEEEYQDALTASKKISQGALDAAFAKHKLDALLAISNSPAWMIDHANGDSFRIGSSSYAAVSGYPNITVPAGLVSGLPVGVSFIGRPFDEQALIGIAYAFEQATIARQPPELTDNVTK